MVSSTTLTIMIRLVPPKDTLAPNTPLKKYGITDTMIKKGYIHIDRETGNLSFTDAGRKKAEGIYERHQTLTKALMKLGAKPGLAEENACRMEHVVTDEMMEVFRNYIKE